MASPSPPKPWERAGATPGIQSLSTPASITASVPSSTNAAGITSSTALPSVPQRPSNLTSVVNRTASNYSPYNNTSRFGASPYSTYNSPYSRFGGGYGGGGMYGGGYGGMGGMGYGGMGGYGMGGGMGYGMGGLQGDPNDPNSLANSFNQSTQATFQIIESIVGAFGGFAQMLESTYMATHSSFFAMVSVAEQFGNLRTTLGSILGIYTLLRWVRTLLAKLTGRPLPSSPKELTPGAFAKFEGRSQPQSSSDPPRPSKKPFLVFLLAVVGLPYLMGKLIRALAAGQESAANEAARRLGPAEAPIDPATLDFCRAKYDFGPNTGRSGVAGVDLEVKKGDLVAVLSKLEPNGAESEWWRCRSRDGRIGYIPGVWLEQVRTGVKAIAEADSSSGLLVDAPQNPEVSVEAFQKSQFYS
ncbi:MAG: Peroxisomal membrane protein PAS20 [Vezdaea aestivalis]|nr:MAG: Peroxisomal membrane protein PAS20 [Vezdaea aestivalis]